MEDEPLILEEVHQEIKPIKKTKKIKKETQISPAARKMANEANVDINKIEGSGKNGIILKEDVMSLMGSKPSPSERKIKHGLERESENDQIAIDNCKKT